MAMTLVSTTTVGSGGASSIEWTNIPQTAKDLLILCSLRSTASSYSTVIRLNNINTGNFYTSRVLFGNGASVSWDLNANANDFISWSMASSAFTANTFGNGSIYLVNYTNSNNKSASFDGVTETNATTSYQHLMAGVWAQTSAISTVTLSPGSGSFVQYSSASLYLIS